MYPRNADELAQYLNEHPELRVSLPNGDSVYNFKGWDGKKIEFATREERVVTLHIDGGPIEYHADGFTRRVGRFTGEFCYTGSKPWQGSGAQK